MKLSDLDFLTSPAGGRILDDLAAANLSDAATLPLLTRLRKTLTPDHAGAAVEQAALRRKAAGKFGADAARMLFTRDGLEQASDPHIRHYRASEARDFRTIIDACCGIGTDALAFAATSPPKSPSPLHGEGDFNASGTSPLQALERESGGEVRKILGLDLDPLRIEIARYNAAALGMKNLRFEVRDVTAPLPESADLIFFDPARRDDAGRRLHHVERYLPPLSVVKMWDAPHIWAKLSPAVDLDELADYGGTVEFHSVDGDLKEAVLKMRAEGQGLRGKGKTSNDEAEYPPADGTVTEAIRHDADGAHIWEWKETPPEMPEREPRGWLLEPDPALLRAGYVQHLAARLGAAQIDATIAYLTLDGKPETAWARAWRVLDWMPFNLKKLKIYLRENGVGRVTVKKRGHAMTPEELQKALKLDGGGEERVVVLTRVKGQPAIIICDPPNAE